MKFRSDITQGGYKILSLHGPDEFDCYSGVVEADGSFIGLNWGRKGEELECQSEYDLIPIPEPDYKAMHRHLVEYCNSLQDLIKSQNDRIEALEERLDQSCKDLIGRINGLRADYLADQSAVQPSRVDALEERLEALEQRTQPSEKGVWVTRESLKRAFDATQEFLIRNDRFEEIADHLGLEE